MSKKPLMFMPFYSPDSMTVLAKNRVEGWGQRFKTKQSKSQGESENIKRITPPFSHNWTYETITMLIVLN